MPRADDPLATLLWLLARDAVPWGALDAAIVKATGDIPPDLDRDDPLALWAEQAADRLRRES